MLFAVAGAAAWAAADLLLRRDLPGAALLQHLAFRALVAPLTWLTEGEGLRLRVAATAWVLLAGWAAVGRRFAPARRAVVWGSVVLLLCFQAVALGLAVLMERGLALAFAAGGAAWVLAGRFAGGTAAPLEPDGRPPPRPLLAMGLLAALASLYYVYALFMTYGGGYGPLQWLGDRMRSGGGSGTPFLLGTALLLGGSALALLLRRDGKERVLRRLLPAVGLATALGSASAPRAAFPLSLAAVALVALAWPELGRLRGALRWPVRMALPCLLAGLLFGHSYAARALRCPPADDPRVRVLSRPGELFRITPGAGGLLALSMRQARRLGSFDPASGAPIPVAAAGRAAAPGQTPAAAEILWGSPEELVYAPSLDRFFATMTPDEPAAFAADAASTVPKNLLLTLDGRALQVLEITAIPDLCWINTLHWVDSEGLLYIGCEERPGLFRWDPRARAMRDGVEPRRLGDVQDIAFGEGELSDRLWTISLWFGRHLTELSRADLSIRRQLPLGGTQYHLAYEPGSALLFASSYYGGRVLVVDARGWRRIRSLPAGFGTRALAVDSRRMLLLASGSYDGLLRAWAFESPPDFRRLPPVRVGGHVKDIALDSERGRAWTWSQCGLLELDLDAIARGESGAGR